MNREMYVDLWKELSVGKPMVFASGPRQAGKTTLARHIAEGFANKDVLNWDVWTDKRRLTENPYFFETMNRKDDSVPLVILDEIHKRRGWKNYLKGVYDGFADRYRFLVLGSGRLNVYQKGGDSLAGRYFPFTVMPFTVAELAGARRPWEEFLKDPLAVPGDVPAAREVLAALSRLSGFPEPFLSGREAHYRRWALGYHRQVVREDIRDVMDLRKFNDLETLYSLLPSRVGAPLSMDGLARDIQVSFGSVRSWLAIFESFFLFFRLSPWTSRVSRAILKEKKPYFFDVGRVTDPAARFENLVALELFRATAQWTEWGRGDFTLHYLRNRDGEEVDFLVADGRRPLFLVEAKLGDEAPAKALLGFQSILGLPAVQVVEKPGVCRLIPNGSRKILVVSADRWLATLP